MTEWTEQIEVEEEKTDRIEKIDFNEYSCLKDCKRCLSANFCSNYRDSE